MTGVPVPLNGRCPTVIDNCLERPCLVGPKDGWCEWGHGHGTSNGRAAANREAIAIAKQLCLTCPVLEACREWALSEPDPVASMVAGGLSTAERRAWRKYNARARVKGQAEFVGPGRLKVNVPDGSKVRVQIEEAG